MTVGGRVRPIPAVLAVLVRGDAVLLVRRRNPPNAGTWGFPGGRIEPGETIPEATLRELSEETGVAADFVRVLDATESIGADAGGVAWHFVLVAGLCRWRAGEPLAADDAAEAAWVPFAALPGLRPDMVPMVEAFAEAARRQAADA